jgi:hypothetical protein
MAGKDPRADHDRASGRMAQPVRNRNRPGWLVRGERHASSLTVAKAMHEQGSEPGVHHNDGGCGCIPIILAFGCCMGFLMFIR